jgi:hypothetical protein
VADVQANGSDGRRERGRFRTMKVTLATHGGQAAAVNLGLPPRAVDTDALSGSAAAELSDLVAAALPTAGEERPTRARDAMSYTITVEDDSQPMVLQRSDNTMSLAFAELLDWLSRHGPTDQPGRTS